MEQLKSKFDHVFIEEACVIDDVAQRFLQIFPPNKISIIKSSSSETFDKNVGTLSSAEFERSKRRILIKKFQGTFFKQCPGAKPGLVCCNYFVLNLGLQCNMNCSYCYLQSYLNTSMTTIYSNIDQALAELRDLATSHPHKPFRVGTGETIDSLSLDPLTHYSHSLIDFFREFPKWTLEFKTKSDSVNQFVNREHGGNVQVSWSINPQNIIDREEHGTASLMQRLAAAKKCSEKGFKIAFHIDPMIWHPQWQDSYLSLVKSITTQFSPQLVSHISIGTLRFQPEQRHMMRERFGMESLVTSAEMFRSRDGKMRYDHSVRNQMVNTVRAAFKSHSSQWRVALCMETPAVSASTMHGSPRPDQPIEALFRPLPKPFTKKFSPWEKPSNLRAPETPLAALRIDP
mgnify:CR=1 FL=1